MFPRGFSGAASFRNVHAQKKILWGLFSRDIFLFLSSLGPCKRAEAKESDKNTFDHFLDTITVKFRYNKLQRAAANCLLFRKDVVMKIAKFKTTNYNADYL